MAKKPLSSKSSGSMKTVLMVAEKPSLALSIAKILSNGRMNSRKGVLYCLNCGVVWSSVFLMIFDKGGRHTCRAQEGNGSTNSPRLSNLRASRTSCFCHVAPRVRPTRPICLVSSPSIEGRRNNWVNSHGSVGTNWLLWDGVSASWLWMKKVEQIDFEGPRSWSKIWVI